MANMYQRIFFTGSTAANNFKLLLQRNNNFVSQPIAYISGRKLEGKLGIPQKPKRPLAPFIQFTLQERKNVVKENPNLLSSEVLKILGQKWSCYSLEEKEKLKEKYKEDLDKYTKELMEYEQKLTTEQKQMLKDERAKINSAAAKSKMKTRLRDLGRPKKPPTAFILYMLSRQHTKNSESSFPEWLSKIGKEWTNLPDDQKQKYEAETKKLMEQYKIDMTLWEEKMIKMGHIDVVRRRVLLDLKGKNSKA